MQGTKNVSNIQSSQIQSTVSKNGKSADEKLSIQQMFASILGSADKGILNQKSANKNLDTADNSYKQYKFKDNNVQMTRISNNDAKSEQLKSEAENDFGDIRNVIKEQLDVTDEDIENAMETLGLGVIDLFDAQKLAELVSNLKGDINISDMIMDADFQQIMADITSIKQDIAKTCGIDIKQLNQIIDNMDLVNEPIDEIVSDFMQDVNVMQENVSDNGIMQAMQNVTAETENLKSGNRAEIKDNMLMTNEPESGNEFVPDQSVIKSESDGQQTEGYSGTYGQSDGNSDKSETPYDKLSGINDNEARQNGAESKADILFEMNSKTLNELSNDMVKNTTAGSSNSSIDTIDVIRQITEQVRVSVSQEETSMEMQLTPENLGKIYINVSQKNSQLTAHMMVMNELVRDALESQMSNLRDNLNQAGLKVDAVEVTVASHEFEQNLEQNGSNEQKQAEKSEVFTKTRKNINMSSIGEDGEILTEEENLVAQIMHDNGNSVDLMA